MSIKGEPTPDFDDFEERYDFHLNKEPEYKEKLLKSERHQRALENFFQKVRWSSIDSRNALASFLENEEEHKDVHMFSSIMYLSLTGSLYKDFPSIYAINFKREYGEPNQYNPDFPFAFKTLSESQREKLWNECEQAAELLLVLPDNTFKEKMTFLRQPDSAWKKMQKKIYENLFWTTEQISLTIQYITGQRRKENPKSTNNSPQNQGKNL